MGTSQRIRLEPAGQPLTSSVLRSRDAAMITLRPSAERGHADHGWLDARHTFSFADYFDREHMGFRDLRVLNEDRIAPGRGFGQHPHQDMEILTWILSGALQHSDDMGNGSVIRPGDIQRMSAGTGVVHSEANPSSDEPTHLLQIWLQPEASGLEPGYEEAHFDPEQLAGGLCLIASHEGREGSVHLNQDLDLYAAKLGTDERVRHELQPGRHAWLQVTSGSAVLADLVLGAGDAAAISEEAVVEIRTVEGTEFLLFDLR